MAKRNQVTMDIKLNANAQLKNASRFEKEIDKVLDKFNFGQKNNNMFSGYQTQIKRVAKELEKLKDKNIVSEDELRNMRQLGKEIDSIIKKGERLYSSLEAKGLTQYNKQYIASLKEAEKEVEKLKNAYEKSTGNSFDKDIKKLDEWKNKLQSLKKEQSALEKVDSYKEAAKQIEKINKAYEEQINKQKELRKIEQEANKAYKVSADKVAQERGYKDSAELFSKRAKNESTLRKELGSNEYKKIVTEYREILKISKEIEKSQENKKQKDNEALKAARQYRLENVKTYEQLKQYLKAQEKQIDSVKYDKEKLLTQEKLNEALEKEKQLREAQTAARNAGAASANQVYGTTKSAFTRSLNAVEAQVIQTKNEADSADFEQVLKEVTDKNVAAMEANTKQQEEIKQNISKVTEYMGKITTITEKATGNGSIASKTDVQTITDKDGNETREAIDAQTAEILPVKVAQESQQSIQANRKNLLGEVSELDRSIGALLQGEQIDFFDVENVGRAGELISDITKEIQLIEVNAEALTDNSINKNAEDFKASLNGISQSLDIIDLQLDGIDEEFGQHIADKIATVQEQILSMRDNRYSNEKGQVHLKSGVNTEEYNSLEAELARLLLVQQQFNHDVNIARQRVGELSGTVKTSTTNFQNLDTSTKETSINLRSIASSSDAANAGLDRATKQASFLGSVWDDLKSKVTYFLSMNYLFDMMTRKIKEATTYTKNLDKDFTQIGLVLGKTSGQVWKNFDNYSAMADRLNTTTSDVAGAMKLFYQQGLNTVQVNKMVEASAIAAALGETSMAEASETLTAVINSYNLSANDAMAVTDKISQVAIVSAADFNEISIAVSKVASSAATAGVDLDHLMGYLATMIETTREAPTNIGTALKTIVANFEQFKEAPEALTEEGSNINKVDKALKAVNISLTDGAGEVRDLSDVLDELGEQWDTLSRSQKAYLATQIAGTRQQSRFFALMNDWGRTQELVAEAANSNGKAQRQFALYNQSLESSTNRLTNQWEKFLSSITSGNGLIKNATDLLTGLMKVINAIGPIGTALGLTAFLAQMKGAVNQINLFKDATNQLDFTKNDKIINAFRRDSGVSEEDKRKLIGESNIPITEDQLKSFEKIASYKADISQINNQIKAIDPNLGKISKGFQKIKLSGQKGWNSIKIGAVTAGEAVKAFGRAMATAAIQMAAMWAIGKVIEGITSAIDAMTTSADEWAERADKARENAETIKGLRDEYEKLSKTVNRTEEQEKRLQEITKEVSEISAELGDTLRSNVDAFQDNVAAMDEYIKKQEAIAGKNGTLAAIQAVRDKGGFGNNWSRFWNKTFGDARQGQLDTETIKGGYQEIYSGISKTKGLSDTQNQILERYAENLIRQSENINGTDANKWIDGVYDFRNAVEQFANNVSSLTDRQQQEYSDLVTAGADKTISYSDYFDKIFQSNLPQEIQNDLFSQAYKALENNVKTITNKTGLSEIDARSIVSELPRDLLASIFNPANFDTLSETEQREYLDGIKAIFNSENLEDIIADLKENGLTGLEKRLENLNGVSDLSIELIKEVAGGLVTLEETIEKAKKAFESLEEIIKNPTWTGSHSQLDILQGLAKGEISINDIGTIGGTNLLKVNFDGLLEEYNQAFADIKAPYQTQLAQVEKELSNFENLSGSVLTTASDEVTNSVNRLNDSMADYRDSLTKYSNEVDKLSSITDNMQQVTDNYTNLTTKSMSIGPVGGLLSVGYTLGYSGQMNELKTQFEDQEAIVQSFYAQLQTAKGTALEDIDLLHKAREIYITTKAVVDSLNESEESKEDIAKRMLQQLIAQKSTYEDIAKIVDEQGNQVGVLERASGYGEKVKEENGEKIISQNEINDIIKNNAEDITLISDETIKENVKNIEMAEKVIKDGADETVKHLQGEKQQLEITLEGIDAVMNQTVGKINAYTAAFESFSTAGQVKGQLDQVAQAYQLLEKGAEGYFDVAQAIANDPSLIEALDLESEYLEFDKQKLNEVAEAHVEAQMKELQARLEGVRAIIGLIQAQMNGDNEAVQNELDNLDTKADIISEAMAYEDSLTTKEEDATTTENENLKISVSNWQQWQQEVVKVIQNVENARAQMAANAASNSTTAAQFRTVSTSYSGQSGKSSTVDSTSKHEENRNKYKNLLNTIQNNSYDENAALLEKYRKTEKVLEKSLGSLSKIRGNIGGYMSDLAGVSGGSGGSGSKDNFDPVEKELERFYNYLRKIEKLEAKITNIRNKRSLQDQTKNYSITNLQEENELLREQQKLYSSYINDETSYLDELQKRLLSDYSQWVSFNDEGVIQVKQTEFVANSEAEQEYLEEFMDLQQKYQDEYNTREDNKNKLLEIENTQLENIQEMYDKILQRVTDVTEEIERQQGELEHAMTMSFGAGEGFDIMNDQMEKAAEGIRNCWGYLNQYSEEITKLNREIEKSPLKELLAYDEALQMWRVDENKLADPKIVKKFTDMGYTTAQIEDSVRKMAKSSENLRTSWNDIKESANSFAEALRSLVDERIDSIESFFSEATEQINKIYDTFDRRMSRIDDTNSLFGVDSDDLEERYGLITTAIATLKLTNSQLRKNQDTILKELVEKYREWVSVVNGVVVVNSQAVRESTKLADAEKAELLQLVGAFDAAEEQIQEFEDKQMEYFKMLAEMEEAKRDTIISLKQEIHDELIKRDQDEIDALQEKYNVMSKLDNEYYSELSQRVNDSRNLRNERQQSTDIAQMQARLAVLKADNSGSYNSELIELQKQIQQQLQEQADNEVDKELERIQREQQQREEDRALTITAMENLLTFKDENNWYWQAAEEIWESGQQAIAGFFMETDGYINTSAENRAKLMESLQDNLNTSFAATVYKQGETAALVSGAVTNAADAQIDEYTNTINPNIKAVQADLNSNLGTAGAIWGKLEEQKETQDLIKTNTNGTKIAADGTKANTDEIKTSDANTANNTNSIKTSSKNIYDSLTGSTNVKLDALPGGFRQQIEGFYEAKVNTEKDVKNAIQSYFENADNPVLNKIIGTTNITSTVNDNITKGNTTVSTISNTLKSVLNLLTGESYGDNSVFATIRKTTEAYLGQNGAIYKWLDENYGKKNGKVDDQVGKNTDSVGKIAAGNKSSSGNNNSNSKPSSGTNAPSTPSSSGGGDGKAWVGDVVTLHSGSYWETSYGGGNSGTIRRGVTGGVVIDKLSSTKYGGQTSSSATGSYDVHIKSADGKYPDLGWVKLSQLKGYNKGGYVDYTGLANVHGSRTSPEAFLNAKQTRLFETLRDNLMRAASTAYNNDKNNEITKEEYNIGNVNIEVKELTDTDSIEKVTKKVKEEIYKDATGKNNMAVRRR